MKIIIIGAGLAGSITAGALSQYKPIVLEKKIVSFKSLSNHYAVMRLRNPDVAKYIGCNIEEIKLAKSIFFLDRLWNEATITMNNLYSMKIYHSLGRRSLLDLGSCKTRFLLKDALSIEPTAQTEYGCNINKIEDGKIYYQDEKIITYDICVSTMPMPALIKLCDIVTPIDFTWQPIYIATAKALFNSKVHQTIYFPEDKFAAYRATLEGNKLMVESMKKLENNIYFEKELEKIITIFGLRKKDFSSFVFNKQSPGKIISIDDDWRRRIILNLTKKHNIYSFGRYAVWRSLRTDHLLDDIEKIKRLIRIEKGDVREYASKLDSIHT